MTVLPEFEVAYSKVKKQSRARTSSLNRVLKTAYCLLVVPVPVVANPILKITGQRHTWCQLNKACKN